MRRVIALVPLILAAGRPAAAQQARPLDAGPDGTVTFRYASRPDVCGGPGLLRVGAAGGPGEVAWRWAWHEGAGAATCDPGPARVVLVRSGGTLASLRVGVGVPAPAGATDLGALPAARAAGMLLEVAGRAEGRVAREALVAAALADSADLAPGLLALARDSTRPRALREGATGWLGRELAGTGTGLVPALADLARDPDAPRGVRTRAVTALGHGGASATAALIELTRGADVEVARAAVGALGRSADPRAREAVRHAAAGPDLPERGGVRSLCALGGPGATAADLAALRGLWPALGGSAARGAVLDALADHGGSGNASWLLGVAEDAGVAIGDRTRAVRAAERAGAGSEALGTLYDRVPDRRVREAVLAALARIGDRAARARLEAVARGDTDPALRRSAVRHLAQLGGSEAVAALEALLDRP
jgi:hypothetical protein